MKLTNKTAGLGLAAVAVLMLGTAAIADKMGERQMGMGGHQGMMDQPELNFDAVDANKDGKITQDEINAYRAARAAALDANGDGKLSVEELANMRLIDMKAAAEKMAQMMVDRLDTDGDKMLSAAEMAGGPMMPMMFDRMDTNHDGAIDKAEADAAKQMMKGRMPGRDGGRQGKHDGRGHDGPGMNGAANDGTDNGGN